MSDTLFFIIGGNLFNGMDTSDYTIVFVVIKFVKKISNDYI